MKLRDKLGRISENVSRETSLETEQDITAPYIECRSCTYKQSQTYNEDLLKFY